MKKAFALILCIVMIFSGCFTALSTNIYAAETANTQTETSIGETLELNETMPNFTGMNDPELLSYVENNVYSNLVQTLGSDEYFVENVEALYISQEYVDELAYNSI